MTRTRKFSNSLSESRLILALCTTLLFLFQAGCGGGGSSSPNVAAITPDSPPALQSFKLVSDDYGVENATYVSATGSGSSIVLRAAVASSMTDPQYRTVMRLEITAPDAVTPSSSYALGGSDPLLAPFPGAFQIFNGRSSTLLRTVAGSITFTSFGTGAGERIAGSFSATIEDGNDSTLPRGTYTVAGTFDLAMESYGGVLPAVPPVAADAAVRYQEKCASCHTLGSIDEAAGAGPELSLLGGRMNGMFPPDAAGHKGVVLTTTEIADLKVLLNVN